MITKSKDQFNDQIYNFLFIIMTILVINNFLFYKLISKVVTLFKNIFDQ